MTEEQPADPELVAAVQLAFTYAIAEALTLLGRPLDPAPYVIRWAAGMGDRVEVWDGPVLLTTLSRSAVLARAAELRQNARPEAVQ